MINGNLILLRPPSDRDIEFLIALRNNIKLQTQLMALPRANHQQKVKDWLNNHLNNPQSLFFIIAEKPTNQPCGYIQIVDIDWTHSYGNLGICIAPENQQKGYGKEAMILIEKYVMQIFDLRKIILKVLANNQPAIKLYQKIGYHTVGIHQKHFYHNHQFLDVMIMEKLLTFEQVDLEL
jgi:diamine N-acetyltransferase